MTILDPERAHELFARICAEAIRLAIIANITPEANRLQAGGRRNGS